MEAGEIIMCKDSSVLKLRKNSLSRKLKKTMNTLLQLTKKPVKFDHIQLKVVNEIVDIEEMAHQCHQAVT